MEISDEKSLLFNQSLEKGLGVLSAFNADRPQMTLAEVAEAADISKSSAQRMVVTLEQLGFLAKHPKTRRYQLTPRVMQIGFSYLASNPIIDLANPFLAELTNLTGESTCMTVPDGLEMVYVARFISSKFVPVHMPIGSRIPMYCTGSGRAYLGALPPAEALEMLKSSDRIAHTHLTLTSVQDVLRELKKMQRLGYAVNKEELFLGDMTIASPILNSSGRPVAALHIVAPTSRWSRDEVESRLGPATVGCARTISVAIRAIA